MGKLLNVNELCEYLRIRKAGVYRLTSSRGIPMIKLGNRVLFDQAKMEEWLESQAVGGGDDAA